uniref:Uncharacterized protein n=1 Tax=Spermophilus dauricus TaxID=99837 RepID=A0A8C9PVN3_SPEDA
METLALKPKETALSTQDPALSPKENPEDKSDWSLLAARSELGLFASLGNGWRVCCEGIRHGQVEALG